ncbi:MAG TPA: tyrosine-type recombinase/integrase [Solirubrobacteraceae bacterium]|jgi:integrase/recombinase XerC|nr:tyrosine-type recombinase/integrase [Solirubrobacteraceae bacterium]
MAFTSADRLALGALEATLAQARDTDDGRPALEVLAGALVELGVRAAPAVRSARLIARDRDAWLRRLQSAGRGESTRNAYRIAIDDLLAWAQREQRTGDLFDEQAIVDYLDDYRQRCDPAAATYYRRFVLLRRFMQWLSRRQGTPDPFLELEAPSKPQQERDWLTHEEFARLLDAAGRPQRRRPGLVERDRLVLRALVLTGLRRSELIAVRWRDVNLEGPRPSLLVAHGKGGKPRRQPLPSQLSDELQRLHYERQPAPEQPVFCGLAGRRLQPTALARTISRCATRAGMTKHVTAHTLRHTSATWLRQATGDTRLVAEYLGHADLSTVSRYAHVASEEMHAAVQALADQAGVSPTQERPQAPRTPRGSARRPRRPRGAAAD